MNGFCRCNCCDCVDRRRGELRCVLESKFGSPAPDPSRRHFIEGLRAVAAFYESHPEAYYDGMGISLNMYVAGASALPRFFAAAKVLECPLVSLSAGVISASRRFSPKVKVELFAKDRGLS